MEEIGTWYEKISLKEAKTFIQSNMQNVDRSMMTIGRSVIAIGFYLKHIRDQKLYVEEGYGNIWDFAAGEYNISKSTASRYMKMNDRYSVDGNSPIVAEQFQEFGKSQLQEMLYLTDEQLEEVTPDQTVAQIRDMRQQEKEDDQIPGQQEIERDYPEWCPSSGGSVTISAEDFGIPEEEIPKEEKREPFTISLDDLMEPVAMSQPEKTPCIHRPQFDCHLTAEQMLIPGDGKDCQGKCCWDCTNKGNCTIECYSSAGRPEDQEQLSAYGTPKKVYPEGSLISTAGCEGGHDCFVCAAECGIRGEERHCRYAPLGNPFPCDHLHHGLQDIRKEIGETCQFINHDLAEHFFGTGDPNPCCMTCKNLCVYVCDRAKIKLHQKEEHDPVVDIEFEEIPQQDDDGATDLEILKAMLEKEKKYLEEVLNIQAVEPHPSLEKMIHKKKLLVGALAGMLCDLEQPGVGVPEEADMEQPELPELRNNDQRKTWLNTYPAWPVWFEVPEANEVYYRYDLPDGSSLVICEYRYWLEWLENPERIGTREYILTPGYHYLEDCKSNRTAMVDLLKEIQRKEKK